MLPWSSGHLVKWAINHNYTWLFYEKQLYIHINTTPPPVFVVVVFLFGLWPKFKLIPSCRVYRADELCLLWSSLKASKQERTVNTNPCVHLPSWRCAGYNDSKGTVPVITLTRLKHQHVFFPTQKNLFLKTLSIPGQSAHIS